MDTDAELVGSICGGLTEVHGNRGWRNGRFISSCWDMNELMEKKLEILEKDLLKFRGAVI
jgi:hypothetical protein